MSYYKTLGAVFVIMMASVLVQGSELFSDIFFVVAYAIMGLVLVMGMKFENNSRTALSIGFILILSVGFLSTVVLVDFFTSIPTVSVIFKMATALSLDVCALFFLYYGRNLRRLESMKHGLDQYGAYKEHVLE